MITQIVQQVSAPVAEPSWLDNKVGGTTLGVSKTGGIYVLYDIGAVTVLTTHTSYSTNTTKCMWFPSNWSGGVYGDLRHEGNMEQGYWKTYAEAAKAALDQGWKIYHSEGMSPIQFIKRVKAMVHES